MNFLLSNKRKRFKIRTKEKFEFKCGANDEKEVQIISEKEFTISPIY